MILRLCPGSHQVSGFARPPFVVMHMDVNRNDQTVPITGGAGFVGSNLTLRIQQRFSECRIVVFDAFVRGHFRNLRGFRGQTIAGDIACREDLRVRLIPLTSGRSTSQTIRRILAAA